MTYKKYIKRGGKIFGPYIYHSRKVNGKVISEYLGKSSQKNRKNKKLIFLIISLIFLFSLFFILSYNYIKITGFLTYENQSKDLENESLAFLRFAIPISNAEHLDSERNFISDIYNEVKELDNIWSEEIPDTHYVRVTFEENLTSKNHIKLYLRIVSGKPKIEIYEVDGTEIIAEFTNIKSNEYNKVYLNQLGWQGSQDTFDIRVLDGSIEIEHIVDPDKFLYTENSRDESKQLEKESKKFQSRG